MYTDLFGPPLTGCPPFALSLHQKRQATLLYHWMSLDYLKELKAMIDRLIAGTDVLLDSAHEQGRDAVMTSPRWGVRDTSANWSTHVYPALEAFRESTTWYISARVNEVYGCTGANQCSRMISEYSSIWMTPEEEERFNEEFAKVDDYAGWIDSVCGAGGSKRITDHMMSDAWQEFGHTFPRLPRFRVRTDIVGESGRVPPRTGVYVAQDDPHATLQYGWTGNSDGQLGRAMTLNKLGLRALAAVGREELWGNRDAITHFVSQAIAQGEITDRNGFDPGDEDDPRYARAILTRQVYAQRPCTWYFVEMIDGEYDEDDKAVGNPLTVANGHPPNVPAGQPCPAAGWWFSPAQASSRRYFKEGELMPALGGDYGDTYWQWSPDQSAPQL
ncbi:hypothetical protein AZOA_07130 [Azoarcus sp. Aa7]|nr:hypothetical protein [Azoarcus sp. Aa7]